MTAVGDTTGLLYRVLSFLWEKQLRNLETFSHLLSEGILESWAHSQKKPCTLIFFSFTFLPQPCLRVYNSRLLQPAWGKSPLRWCFHGNGGAEGLQGQSGSTWSRADGRMEAWPCWLSPRWAVVMLLLDISSPSPPPAWDWHDKLSPDTGC